MRTVVPTDAKRLIVDSLKTLDPDFKDKFGWTSSGINTLMARKNLARDPEIIEALLRILCSSARGFRLFALRVLTDLEHPQAADHLAYNSLRIHPLLQQDQAMVSGWSDLESLWNVGLFGTRHFTMFVEDMRSELQTFHGDLLGKIDQANAENELLPVLEMRDKRRVLAAYALALRGSIVGQDALKESLSEHRYAPLCIRALSLCGDTSAIGQIEAYSSPDLAYFHTGKTETDEYLNSRLNKLAREAIELLSAASPEAKLALFKRLYIKTAEDLRRQSSNTADSLERNHARRVQRRRSAIAEEMHEKRMSKLTKIDPKADLEILSFGNGFAYEVLPLAADFIDRFLDETQRQTLVEFQSAGVRKLLDPIDKSPDELGVTGRAPGWAIPWRGLVPTSHDYEDSGTVPYYIRGFELKYDRDDFIAASIDWITNPDRHYQGISRYDYMFSEILQ